MSSNSKPKKISFTDEEDEELIEHISGFQYIWDIKHPDYKSYKKDKVWQDIADKLRRKKDECQSRWKSIRDHYKRQTKEDIGKTGSAAKKKKRANYWDMLSFLDTIEDERNTFSNISLEAPETSQSNHQHTQQDIINDTSFPINHFEVASETDETCGKTSALPVIRPQRKTGMENSAIVKRLKEKKDQHAQFNDSIKELLKLHEQDDIDLFFRSIAITVKKFQPHLISKTKMKVLEIVSDMEQLHHLTSHQHCQSELSCHNSST